MKYLIAAADDFGLTKSINEGIAMACREGIATAVNLMPAGEAFDDAVARLKDLKNTSAGAHLALTEVNEKFPANYISFFTGLCAGRIGRDWIYAELKKQMERIRRAGVKIENLSSHEHVHMAPTLLEIFVNLAKEYGIPSIRYVREKRTGGLSIKRLYRQAASAVLSAESLRALNDAGIRHPDRVAGFLDAGSLNEQRLIGLIGSLEDGVTELISHPGFLSPEVVERFPFHKNCEAELAALVSRLTKRAVEEQKIRLIGYGEINAGLE